jgi:hypothetical protein
MHGAAAPIGAVVARVRPRKKPGWAGLGRIGRAERAGCQIFQGNDMGYQGELGRIDNGVWQILFTIFEQRFGF